MVSERNNKKMLRSVFKCCMYSFILLSLFAVDHAIGNGVMDTLKKFFCNFVCFGRHALKKENKYFVQGPGSNDKINTVMILGEVALLTLTIMVSFSLKR